MVQRYLQLGRNFLRDSQEQTLSIPKDVAFMDSKVRLDPKLSDSPMRDFRPTTQFVLSKASAILARRCDGDIARYPQMGSDEVQCNIPYTTCICRNLRGTIASFRERNPHYFAQCSSDLNSLFVLMPELKDLLKENVPALCEFFTLQPLRPSLSELVKPAEKGADGCSSQTITLGIFSRDDFASDSDDDELTATQPPAAESEVVAEVATVVDLNGIKECLIGEMDRPNSSCTPSDVVPQSDPPSEPGDINDEVMGITMQAPFDSVPCELQYSSLVVDPEPDDQKLLILSVSRKAVSSMK